MTVVLMSGPSQHQGIGTHVPGPGLCLGSGWKGLWFLDGDLEVRGAQPELDQPGQVNSPVTPASKSPAGLPAVRFSNSSGD